MVVRQLECTIHLLEDAVDVRADGWPIIGMPSQHHFTYIAVRIITACTFAQCSNRSHAKPRLAVCSGWQVNGSYVLSPVHVASTPM